MFLLQVLTMGFFTIFSEYTMKNVYLLSLWGDYKLYSVCSCMDVYVFSF